MSEYEGIVPPSVKEVDVDIGDRIAIILIVIASRKNLTVKVPR